MAYALFLSTPSARRATYDDDHVPTQDTISIHALREEGDCHTDNCCLVDAISIHALREEGDRFLLYVLSLGFLFLSTPSARRATRYQLDQLNDEFISIHALREEGDVARVLNKVGGSSISIHALREEGDASTLRPSRAPMQFLSTPSARRATLCHDLFSSMVSISIHALREEGDSGDLCTGQRPRYFYPRPPRGGRPVLQSIFTNMEKFLSTPSARRATAKTETKSLFSNKLYNILHEFRRALIYNGSKNYPNHAK